MQSLLINKITQAFLHVAIPFWDGNVCYRKKFINGL
jgi:hypothetical protein